MSTDHPAPVVLTVLPSEVLAAMFLARLRDEGIVCEMAGGLSSGFRTEAPGGVKILVRHSDLVEAQKILKEWNSESQGDGGPEALDEDE